MFLFNNGCTFNKSKAKQALYPTDEEKTCSVSQFLQFVELD